MVVKGKPQLSSPFLLCLCVVLLVKLFLNLNFCFAAAKEKLGHVADGLDHLQKDVAEVQTLTFTFISIQKSKPAGPSLCL